MVAQEGLCRFLEPSVDGKLDIATHRVNVEEVLFERYLWCHTDFSPQTSIACRLYAVGAIGERGIADNRRGCRHRIGPCNVPLFVERDVSQCNAVTVQDAPTADPGF